MRTALSPPQDASRVPVGFQLTNQQRESGWALSLCCRVRASFIPAQVDDRCIDLWAAVSLSVTMWQLTRYQAARHTLTTVQNTQSDSHTSLALQMWGNGMFLPMVFTSKNEVQKFTNTAEIPPSLLSAALRKALWGFFSGHKSETKNK